MRPSLVLFSLWSLCWLLSNLATAVAAEPLRFDDDALRHILHRSCAECHDDGKRKGGLARITDLERMIAEEWLIPGEPNGSLIYTVLIAPNPSDRMPPKKALHSPALRSEEIAAVRQWILDRAAGPVQAAPTSLPTIIQPVANDSPTRETDASGTVVTESPDSETTLAGDQLPPAGDTPAVAEQAPPSLSLSEYFLLLLGRWHPLVVHFPVAMLVVLGLHQAWAAVRRQPLAQGASGILIAVGSTGSVIAVMTGWWAAEYGFSGFDVFVHRWTGVALAVSNLIAWVLWVLTRREARWAWWYGLALVVVVALVVVTGHYGNTITRGDPNWLWSP